MECNKDEALRAKEIAERLLETDITGAKKFALKAQYLFPNLEGLSQLLEVIDVYVAHEKKINGEVDYYGIFGVDPFTDEVVLKKRYKRMALSLHPDKNKSAGADGAFKILSGAWSVLSDKDKRNAYDLKLNISASNQTGRLSSSSTQFTATNSQNVTTRPQTPPTTTSQWYAPFGTSGQQGPRLETFWTLCSWCSVLLEYSKIFLNQYLMCDHCKQPFLAIEVFVPSVNNHGSHPWRFPNQQNEPTRPWTPPTATNQQYTTTSISHHQTPGPPLHQHYTPSRSQTTWIPHALRHETFWMSCSRCGIQFEHKKIYLNQILLCNNCKKPFLAIEVPAPLF